MKDLITKPSNFSRVEFWGATTVFVFAVFFLISNALHIGMSPRDSSVAHSPFDYFFVSTLLRYVILYSAFLLLNFRIVPELIKKKNLFLQVFITIMLFVVIGLAFGLINTFLKYSLIAGSQPDAATHNIVFQKSFLYAVWLLLMFGFYSVIKYTGLYLLSRSEDIRLKYRLITPGGLAAFVLWMICLFFLIVGGADPVVIGGWCTIIPFAIFFYWYALYSLIPKALTKRKPFRNYAFRTLIVLLIAVFPTGFLAMAFTRHDDAGLAIALFGSAFQLFITAPFAWVVYRRQMQGAEEVSHLKKELGQSHANFDFLRSQINPHFLFNALNTIYGTALQEKAERTSEGIEKLGDMMRFMLQENMQDKISLAREIDYLNNYISFQKLRTDPDTSIRIESAVQQPVQSIQIAPMLLIPFVENAFKHGISFREPSHIKITLEMKENVVYFDVYNSKHLVHDNDPEKNKSGIGLTNVRQRLQLLYPKKHELIVRETGKDFFVHLTIQLS